MRETERHQNANAPGSGRYRLKGKAREELRWLIAQHATSPVTVSCVCGRFTAHGTLDETRVAWVAHAHQCTIRRGRGRRK